MRNTRGSFPSPSHTPQTTPLHINKHTHAHTRAHTRARTHRTHARTITGAVTTTTDDWAWLLLVHFATGLDGPIRSQANAAPTDKTIWLRAGGGGLLSLGSQPLLGYERSVPARSGPNGILTITRPILHTTHYTLHTLTEHEANLQNPLDR